MQRGHENLETIAFDMVLDRGLNPLSVDCRKLRDLLYEMLKTGDACPLVIGTSYIGAYLQYYFVLLQEFCNMTFK